MNKFYVAHKRQIANNTNVLVRFPNIVAVQYLKRERERERERELMSANHAKPKSLWNEHCKHVTDKQI